MDVKAVQAELARFAAERGWEATQTPRNLAVALAVEASVVLELFKWQTDAEANAPVSARLRDGAADALADVLLQALRLADRLGVDLEAAVAQRLARNAAKYPLAPAATGIAAAAETAEEEVVILDLGAGTPGSDPPAPAAAPDRAEAAPSGSHARAPEPQPPSPPAPAPGVEPPVAPASSDTRSQPEAPQPAPRAEKPSRRAREGAPRPAPSAAAPAPPAPPSTTVTPPAGLPAEAPAPAAPVAPVAPPAPPAAELYPNLDPDAALALARSLGKKLDQARTHDPLLREIHDELETLKRALYAPVLKKAWVAGSLKTLRGLLESAAGERCGEEIDAERQVADVDRLLRG